VDNECSPPVPPVHPCWLIGMRSHSHDAHRVIAAWHVAERGARRRPLSPASAAGSGFLDTCCASKPTCDADCHVTLGRERPSGSICDSLAANGGGKYLPTYVRRVLAVS
jgi:hypothetical protein